MNRIASIVAGLLLLAGPISVRAQVPNEGLANQIIAARQKNVAMMQQYNWNCETQLINKGNIEDTRIDAVIYGPDGTLQRTVINDDPASVPGGFLRKAMAENQRKDIDKYLNGLHKLLDQYTLSSAGAVINFVSQAAIQTGNAPDGTPTLTLTGNNVINPGDVVSITLNPTNFQPLRAQISTPYEEQQATMTATFKTIKTGLTHLQFATIVVPAKEIAVQIHNYDYVPND